MKSRKIVVNSGNRPGVSLPAALLICDVCESSTFHNIMIGPHQHLQCAICAQSYCDGKCTEFVDNAAATSMVN